MTDSAVSVTDQRALDKRSRLVILASSVGTVIEWYDFYLYGSLAAIITTQFFSGVNETTGYIFALMAFAASFAVRPFGAIVFGRLGDLWGRKNTFLVTMLLMGLSTFVVGLLPPTPPSASPRRSSWSPCGWFRVWRWVGNTAGRPPMSPSTRRTANAVSIRPSSRSRRRRV